MAMDLITATSTVWIEAPRGSSAAVVLQNQSFEEVTVRVQPTIPSSLTDPGLILDRLEEKTFRDFAVGDKLWVKSRSLSASVLIWK